MERGIFPIAVLYFAVKRSFFNFKKLCRSTRVPVYQGYHFGSPDVIGHVIIILAVAGFLSEAH